MSEQTEDRPPEKAEHVPDSPAEAAAGKSGDNSDDKDNAHRDAGNGRNAVLMLLGLLVLIAVAASGYSFYLSYELRAQQAEAGEAQRELASRLETLRDRQAGTGDRLARLAEVQEATSARLQRLAERDRMDNFDWAMAEVEYLTIIAMQRLNLAHDADNALAALEAAARRLKDIDNPGLIPVREQLTADINALREVPEADVSGLALYLGDLITRVDRLPLADDSATRTRLPRDDEADEPAVDGWRGFVSAIWSELRELVVIQREDEPPTELLAPAERYFLVQNLRVELASARTAALRRDTPNMRTSLELVQDWLVRYFNTDAESVANIRETLAQMSGVDLKPELPDISGSLESVRAWQRRRQDRDAE